MDEQIEVKQVKIEHLGAPGRQLPYDGKGWFYCYITVGVHRTLVGFLVNQEPFKFLGHNGVERYRVKARWEQRQGYFERTWEEGTMVLNQSQLRYLMSNMDVAVDAWKAKTRPWWSIFLFWRTA